MLNLLLPLSLLNKVLKNVNTFSYIKMRTHQLYRTGFLGEVRKRHLPWQNSGNPAQMMCQHSRYQCTHKTVNNMAKYGNLCSSAECFNFVAPTTHYKYLKFDTVKPESISYTLNKTSLIYSQSFIVIYKKEK